ncbi:MAG: hypothetical protein GXP27_00835 [Planctomycetes bacterium]|nr:hypothetical protein [Planctomycetota bacterium]
MSNKESVDLSEERLSDYGWFVLATALRDLNQLIEEAKQIEQESETAKKIRLYGQLLSARIGVKAVVDSEMLRRQGTNKPVHAVGMLFPDMLDVAPCIGCNRPAICVPDGLPMCCECGVNLETKKP